MSAETTCECGARKAYRSKRCRDCAAEARYGCETTDEARAKMSQAAKARADRKRGRPLTPEMGEDIKRLRAEGVSPKVIAERFGLPQSTVFVILAHGGWSAYYAQARHGRMA